MTSPTIAILGAGFGGIALGIQLKKAGIHSFTILERARDVGGVWRDNIYPGAGCDIPSHLYSFSFEHQYDWSRRYAPQSEILAYLRHCATKYGLLPHIQFDTDVREASFEPGAGHWHLSMGDGKTIETQIFVSAVGQFSQPIVPDFPGRDAFNGPQFHSSAWDYGVSLSGKIVAVVGTGASAIQFVPRIVAEAGRVIVFQRSAPYVMPKADLVYSPDALAKLKKYPFLRSFDRLRIFTDYQRRIPRRHSESVVRDNKILFDAYLASQISDPTLLRKVTPDEPWGCKRLLFSNEWYDALKRSNVEVVDADIEAISETGLRIDGGREIRADVIIYGTGFRAAEFLSTLHIQGIRGRTLRDEWRDGAVAHLGVAVSGFPNFFMIFGPNTNVAGSVVYMLESQARYITHCIKSFIRSGAVSIDVKPDVQRRFNNELQERLKTTVWQTGNCRSWFKAASGKITTQWPGLQLTYRMRTRRANIRNFNLI